MSNILSEFDKYASRIDHGQKLQERAFFFQNKGENLFGIFYLPLEEIFEKHKMPMPGMSVFWNPIFLFKI